MDLQLKGSVAFVTGASKGIGKATAWLLAAEGCQVAINAREEGRLRSVAEEIASATGAEVLPVPGDMSVTADVDRCVKATIDHFRQLDIAVPCAGAAPGGLVETLTDDDWLGALNLKFMGYVRTCRAVLPHMKERGRGSIVMVVGNDGLKPPYYEIAPGACNAADINFAACIAEQYGKYGIRINTVNPGPVDTDRWDWIEKSLANTKGVSQNVARQLVNASVPLGRIATAQEIANVVAFLASPLAGFVNGAHIPVDGAQRKALMDADLVRLQT
ncbi:MAG TPA: SDR family oxidoreductase [Candidatus Saccharimonadales bacterium]|nr:SDR family oxidoreductase [Candidatus Saccharimonadales bacterium]